jgi:hypothetical protein
MTEAIGTVTVTGETDGAELRLLLKQAAAIHTITQAAFPSNFKLNNNTYSAPGTNNKSDLLSFKYFGTSTGLFTWFETSRTSNLPE